MKELHVNKKIKYSSDTSTYTVQLKKRRKPWWLLLLLLLPFLLLPLLLLIKFDHSLTVYCYDCESHDPIVGAEVALTYDVHYVFDSTGLFPKHTLVLNGVTDSEGQVKFENVKCGVFCFLFYPKSKREIVAAAIGYPPVDTKVAHHRFSRVKLSMCPEVTNPAVPSTGDVQFLLDWKDYNDLDLACVDPYGDRISFQNKRVRSGGRLEIDMNAGGSKSRDPIENIYWPSGAAPFGTYSVYVTFYAQHETNKTVSHYKLKVVYGDKTEWYEGDISKEDGEVKVCSFTYGR